MRTSVSGSMARTGVPQPMPSATYDAGNELLAWNESALSYDANGNMLSDSVHNYAWDARNQLSTIDSGGTGSFLYDPTGRRTTKVISGTSTSFLYDLANPVQELSGTTPTANLLTGGLDEFFTRTDASGTANFLTDALGSTVALTDSTGTVQGQYSFDPFGNTTQSSTSTGNSFAYAGRENDGTGLYFYRARYYSPLLGRFISEDPMGPAGGINLYRYVDDSPTNAIDPFGLWSTDAHNQIIYKALHPCGVSDHDIEQIEKGSLWIDDNFQDPIHAYMHSMTDGTVGQTEDLMQQLRDQFIASFMRFASNEAQAGGNDQALFDFGAAMHPLMDMTSLAHTDYETGKPRPWCGMFTGCSNTLDHGGDSTFNPFSIEDLAMLDSRPDVQEVENELIRSYYYDLTGRGCHCKH